MTSTTPQIQGATDVGQFLSDLDGGQFERMLGKALSDVAAGTVDNEGKGSVVLKLDFEKVPGAHQVICKHSLTYARPTSSGKASEQSTRKTALHVGKYGRLSFVPESQFPMFTRTGDVAQNPTPGNGEASA